MANILLISGFLPSATSPSSGQKIVYRKLRALARTHQVYLLAFVNELESAFFRSRDMTIGTDLDFLAGTAIVPLSTRHRVLGALLYWRLPLLTSGRYRAGRHVVERCFGGVAFAEVIAEFAQGASLIPSGLLDSTTLVEHDVCFQSYGRRAEAATGLRRLLLRFEYWRLRRWETRLLRRVGRVVVLNDKDRGLVEAASGRRDTELEYPELAEYLRGVRRSEATIVPGTIVFWGHMARRENQDAAIWFAREMFPAILASHPHSRFIIAGADPGPAVTALAGPAIEVSGYLPDPTALFEHVAIAVVPLRHGGGIKIKTLETTALGIPTVATTVGAEGVRASAALIVADDETAIINAIREILDL